MIENPKYASVREAASAERAAFTQRVILDAAEQVFARYGQQGARVRQIADAAGVNVATLYNYYKNKNALYEAVLDQGLQPIIEALKEYPFNNNGEASYKEIISFIMEHLHERPHVSRLIYLEAISDGEYLKKIASKWFRPLLEEIVTKLDSGTNNTDWETSSYPFISALFIHLSFGHFALAPLLKEVFGSDPTSNEGIENQRKLIEHLVSQMFPTLNLDSN